MKKMKNKIAIELDKWIKKEKRWRSWSRIKSTSEWARERERERVEENIELIRANLRTNNSEVLYLGGGKNLCYG